MSNNLPIEILEELKKPISLTAGAFSYLENEESRYGQQNLSPHWLKDLNKQADWKESLRSYILGLPTNSVAVISLLDLDQRRNELGYTGIKGLLLPYDFLIHRVIAKFQVSHNLYKIFSRNKIKAIPVAELMGRATYWGAEILNYLCHEGSTYVIVKKKQHKETLELPDQESVFIFSALRVGFSGELIRVYKFRTMHMYSQFIQQYVTDKNSLRAGGKIAMDFRVTAWGRLFREYWIDELPMLLNFFNGELSLVGVRPLSIDYFNRYPQTARELRIKVKPGLIPPFYADMPNSFSEIVQSEERYVRRKLQSPILTDFIYFWKAVWNIVFRGARSH